MAFIQTSAIQENIDGHLSIDMTRQLTTLVRIVEVRNQKFSEDHKGCIKDFWFCTCPFLLWWNVIKLFCRKTDLLFKEITGCCSVVAVLLE
jgi:hypothetical protein